jgi:hypothetical protein
LKVIQAERIFKYLLPSLNALRPEEILEVRDKVQDTREGFSLHLQRLSKDIEEQLSEDASAVEVSKYAQSVVETELVPDYREFERQLSAENAGFWANVLNKTKAVCEIDVPPWTPKFYAELVSRLGLAALETIEDKKTKLTNKRQAFNFMRAFEQFGQRHASD